MTKVRNYKYHPLYAGRLLLTQRPRVTKQQVSPVIRRTPSAVSAVTGDKEASITIYTPSILLWFAARRWKRGGDTHFTLSHHFILKTNTFQH